MPVQMRRYQVLAWKSENACARLVGHSASQGGPFPSSNSPPTPWEHSEGHLQVDCATLGTWPATEEKLLLHVSLDCKRLVF